jgi:hypothetical protein
VECVTKIRKERPDAVRQQLEECPALREDGQLPVETLTAAVRLTVAFEQRLNAATVPDDGGGDGGGSLAHQQSGSREMPADRAEAAATAAVWGEGHDESSFASMRPLSGVFEPSLLRVFVPREEQRLGDLVRGLIREEKWSQSSQDGGIREGVRPSSGDAGGVGEAVASAVLAGATEVVLGVKRSMDQCLQLSRHGLQLAMLRAWQSVFSQYVQSLRDMMQSQPVLSGDGLGRPSRLSDDQRASGKAEALVLPGGDDLQQGEGQPFPRSAEGSINTPSRSGALASALGRNLTSAVEVSGPWCPFWRPFWLRFTHVPPATKY